MEICKGDGCGVLKPIVNKRYCLCDECNFKRLHHGKSRTEVYRERHDKKQREKPKTTLGWPLNKRPLVAKKRIRQVSLKKADRDREMHKTYALIDKTREPICEGCGRGNRPLSHSHILSQADRPDLAAEAENIRLHCFGEPNRCHETWERAIPMEVMRMDDFKDNMEYIQSVDPQRYAYITAKIEYGKNVDRTI